MQVWAGSKVSQQAQDLWEAPNGRKKPPQPIFFTTLERRLGKKSPWIVGLPTQTGTQEVCYEMDRHMSENSRLSLPRQ